MTYSFSFSYNTFVLHRIIVWFCSFWFSFDKHFRLKKAIYIETKPKIAKPFELLLLYGRCPFFPRCSCLYIIIIFTLVERKIRLLSYVGFTHSHMCNILGIAKIWSLSLGLGPRKGIYSNVVMLLIFWGGQVTKIKKSIYNFSPFWSRAKLGILRIGFLRGNPNVRNHLKSLELS